ncbi:protein of unknown function [Taphrina deformans PYCC 5710]|uniref:Oligopeptide transporter n=1 Tax=Taphrina deformans (strain PYCC 5710 / ATCC 11124 / CBS 356.35 / IMI 108563 / JCM 9778 / NBRC 8474) TaxID=1097556 RepID=R4XFZ8_TAPDE|nr:protein of unknown function [Taphrina deformans PYCC 5710]|eukprot:CCG84806.1 protein of unknown function [Taphrina deformans PYCC 5710]
MTSSGIDAIDFAAAHERSVPFDNSVAHSGVGSDKLAPHAVNEKSQHGMADISLTGSHTADEDLKHPDHPTEEDLATLRKVAGKVPWTAYTVAFVELCERFSYYGSTQVFTNFIQHPLPPGSNTGAGGTNGQSGALGMGQRASTGLTLFNTFWSYIMPLVGAYVADTYLGRFKTIQWSILIALVGHVLLTISAIPSVLEGGHAIGCFIIAILIMGVGTGGFKPNVSSLIAEQYTEKLHVKTLKSGERVIVDPIATISRIYMYFYLMINVGALIGQIGMVYAEKYVGFWLAYALPTWMFLLCPAVMWACRNRYIRTAPQGSILPSAVRAITLASRGRWHLNPIRTVRHMKQADFWERAKPSYFTRSGLQLPSYMTWDDQWVDELRRGIKACYVFLWYPLWWLTYNQILNNLTSQAATMTLNGLPNDVVNNLDPFALIIFIPIFDQVVYPGLAKLGYPLTPIKRITFGFYTGAAAMIWAAVLQHYIYMTSNCGNMASSTYLDAAETIPCVSPLNVWIQTGSYVLIAFSEIAASITGLEYAYTKAPKNMKSIVMSLFLFTSAISTALGEAFVSLSADPLLVWNYGVMAVLSAIGGAGFWLSFHNLDRDEDRLNYLPETHFGAVDDQHNDAEKASNK